MVIGTFELFMTSTAQDTNETMKVLTVATVLIGVAGVTAGVMGMNFELGFYSMAEIGFFMVVAGMILLSGVFLLFARWRRWL